MNKLPLLIKREYWEHRGGFLWTPFWICAAILVLTVIGLVTADVLGTRASVHMGISLSEFHVNMSAEEKAQAGNALDMTQLMFGGIASFGLFFVLFFYLLGALYDDRRDRSVLFWKSLPVTDTATVASKAISAALLAPLIALIVSTLAYLVFVALIGLWAAMHGINVLPALASAHPLGMFGRLLLMLPLGALWALPSIGWLLFWSAWVRSKPFLWAVMLPVVAVLINGWFSMLGLPHVEGAVALKQVVGRLLLSIAPASWIGNGTMIGGTRMRFNLDDAHVLSSFDAQNVYGLLTTANLWIGVAAGLALLAAAVWARGRRIETSV
ncbi:MAG: hypothetical protein GXC76_10500 [Rhodanobacteraceae bacterium]|jgi:ABC-2 type transport system permease protein|nr:hypothetical protein [Rhodanobacteraceae bacterium]